MNPPAEYIPGYHAYPGGPPIGAIHAMQEAAMREEEQRKAENERQDEDLLLLLRS